MFRIGRTQKVEMPVEAPKDQKAGRTQVAQTGQPDAWLVIKSMQGPGNSFPVAVGETLIGRDEECLVQIDHNDEKASRKHAVIHRRAGDTRIYDKASTNGLYVNGQQVPSGGKKLQSGDVVQVGNTELVFSELVRDRGGGGNQETGRTVAVQPAPSEVEEQPRQERGRTMPFKLEEPASAWVIVQGPEGEQRTQGLSNGSYVLGRNDTCDIVLDDQYVSGVHARITVDDHRSSIFDLGSRNKVKVNGKSVEQAQLTAGDVVELGQTRLTFVRSGATEQREVMRT